MDEVKITPIPHNIIEEMYQHVFNNEFEQRKIDSIFDLPFFAISNNWLVGSRITSGEYTCVVMTNSKGESETAHFWKMRGNRWTGYEPRFCYSFIKKSES